jgi:hypothetical protein
MNRGTRLTDVQHRDIGIALKIARGRMWAVTKMALRGRVPRPVLDAAFDVDRRLLALSSRLCDSIGARGRALYPVGAFSFMSLVPPEVPEGLSPEEHRLVGLELYLMRSRLIQLAVEVGNGYPKSSPVGRAAPWPHRAVDRLRARLDALLTKEHPAHFETGVYYPDSGVAAGHAPTPYALYELVLATEEPHHAH